MNNRKHAPLPPAERSDRRGLTLYLTVTAMAIVTACAAVQSNRRASAALDRRAAEVDREWASAAKQAQAAIDLRAAQQSAVRHAELTQTLLELTPRSRVLAEVTNALPPGCWLQEFKLDLADDGLHVKVEGVAPDAMDAEKFAHRLGQSKLLGNVKLAEWEDAAQRGSSQRRFQIDMNIGGSAIEREPAAPPTLTASIGH